MAKAKRVQADLGSLQVEAMVRAHNNLLVVLENVSTLAAAATITPVQAFTAIRDAITNGVDVDNAPYTGTGRLVYGVMPINATVNHGDAERSARLADMTVASKY